MIERDGWTTPDRTDYYDVIEAETIEAWNLRTAPEDHEFPPLPDSEKHLQAQIDKERESWLSQRQ